MSLYQTFKKMQTGPVMIGVAVFGLLTFTITGAVIQTFSHNERGGATTITLPSGAKHTFTEEERGAAALAHKFFYEPAGEYGFSVVQFQALRYMQQLPKLFSQLSKSNSWVQGYERNEALLLKKGRDQKNDGPFQIMLVNALARDRGIEVGLGEVEEFVNSGFETKEQYVGFCRSLLGMEAPTFELALREAMLFRRAMDFALAQTPLPSGDDIIKEWCDHNERSQFEVVAFNVEDNKKKLEEAKDKVTNEELKKWLDNLKDGEKAKYKEPEKIELEGIAVLDPSAAPKAEFDTLIKGVKLDTSDPQAYFDLSRTERFKKPRTESKPASSPETGPASSLAIPEYYTFAEVEEKVKSEVRIARALDQVKAEAEAAAKNPGFDLKAIADKYGLTYWTSGAPVAESAIITIPIHGTAAWRAPLETAKEGDFFPGTQASVGAIQFTRVKKKVEPRIPEVTDIREKLLTDYLEQKSNEDTKNLARDFKDAANDATGDDRFAKVAKDKSYEVKALGYISKGRREEPDFMDEDAKTPTHFIAAQHTPGLPPSAAARTDPFALKKDAIGGPYFDAANKIYYVVRCVDRKEATKADMSSKDYYRVRDKYLSGLRERKCYEMMSSTVLSKQLKLEVPKRESAPAQN